MNDTKQQWNMRKAVELIVRAMLDNKKLKLDEIADVLSAEFDLDKRPAEMAIRVIRNLSDDRYGQLKRVQSFGTYQHLEFKNGRNYPSNRGIYGFTKDGIAWAMEKYRSAPKPIDASADERAKEQVDISSFGFLDYSSLIASLNPYIRELRA